jgi:hypothetical protein
MQKKLDEYERELAMLKGKGGDNKQEIFQLISERDKLKEFA